VPMLACASEVLDFWFGAPGSVTHGKARMEWFKKSPAFDEMIRSRFAPLHEQATDGQLAHWREGTNASPLTLLALIIVCDQFPRNMFRDSPRAFATDAMALDAARQMRARGWDTRLSMVERQFCYLPFEHAEDLDAQRTCLMLFGELGNADLLHWAQKHYDIIERFGRFPHRNAVLGRASTAAEAEFLKQPGSGF
jgi:uncharacterized protein (DUF924 family)